MSQQDGSTRLAGNGDREGPAEDPDPLSPEGPQHSGQSMVNGGGVGGRLVEGGCFCGPRSLISLWTSSQRLTEACHGSGSWVMAQTTLPQDESRNQSPQPRLGSQRPSTPSTESKPHLPRM